MRLQVPVGSEQVVDLDEESSHFGDLEDLLFEVAFDLRQQLRLEIQQNPPFELSAVQVLLFVAFAAVGEDRVVAHQELRQREARVEPLRLGLVHAAFVPALHFLREFLQSLDQTRVDFRQEVLVEFCLKSDYSSRGVSSRTRGSCP